MLRYMDSGMGVKCGYVSRGQTHQTTNLRIRGLGKKM